MRGRASSSERSLRDAMTVAMRDGLARAARQDPDPSLPLLAFVPTLTPTYRPPVHLAPLATAWEAMTAGEVREVWHCPPRHGKTELILHGIARDLARNPRLRIGYATYSADLAESKSRRVLRLVRQLGVDLLTVTADDWETRAGGGMVARGIGGGWTGRGLDRLVIDDPVKDRAEAESKAHRKRLADWFADAAITRVEPGGSVVINMTRWMPNDLAGDRIAEGWTYRRLPAWCDDVTDPCQAGRELGAVLWPERWTDALLTERCRSEYTRASLYQGLPRPRGSALFSDVTFYNPNSLPQRGYRQALGLDLAYTAKASSDWSVLVRMRSHHGLIYLEDVIRRQVAAPAFRSIVAAAQAEHRCPVRIYTGGGSERGVVDLFEAAGRLAIDAVPATADKMVRALPCSEAWNAGRILVPTGAPWLDDLVSEVLAFTGHPTDTDDQVDALVAAYDLLAESGIGMPSRDDDRARDPDREARRAIRRSVW